MQIINWKLISHPLNWAIIWLMVAIGGIFGHLVLTILDQEPATPATPNGLPQGYSKDVTGINATP